MNTKQNISGFVNVADVGPRMPCKLNHNGSVGKNRAGKLKMDALWVSNQGRTEATAEPWGCERPHLQTEDGGCGGANSSHTRQVFDSVQGRDPADVWAGRERIEQMVCS